MASAVKVLLIDDASLIRRLLGRVLNQDPLIEVVGEAENGQEGVELARTLQPQVIILDIEMPVMNGMEALPLLKKAAPKARIIMFSTLTESGARATLDALSAGADDYVTKPSNTGSFAATAGQINKQLAPMIKALAASATTYPSIRPHAEPKAAQQTVPDADHSWLTVTSDGAPEIVVVGVSTGGPQALQTFVPALPADLEVPVLIVQHMPAMFTRLLAERLDAQSAVKVGEATNGQVVKPGEVWFAPGGEHMYVTRQGENIVLTTDTAPPVNECRPAVDPLFESAVENFGSRVLGVMLTGMGNDGLAGSRLIKSVDGYVIVQDQASSVVWGMPGMVAKADLADQILPLNEIAPRVVDLLSTPRNRK
ncbi:chemotaxis response regulator protein-glutamate methylesterase [Stomatohabitans albus]|uniref:protein-glutamate methylesterase/protein-glutamine glutaminase n=1 Tax=Stomatohabitans albus TaxID=3110766 RepID=UPI00300C2C60